MVALFYVCLADEIILYDKLVAYYLYMTVYTTNQAYNNLSIINGRPIFKLPEPSFEVATSIP